MQPKEHKLSQEVLEFLIAHQDWFMLDVAPPPARNAGLVGSDDETEAMLSSDDEANGGPWKLVPRMEQQRLARRRTITEKHGSKSIRLPTAGFVAERHPFFNSVVHGTLTEGIPSDLSPVAEAPGSPIQSVGGSIRRSRTLPTRRGTVESRSGETDAPPVTNTQAHLESTHEERHRGRVLKKQKRSSMQIQRSSQTS